MQSYNHAINGGALSQDYWMVTKQINKKYAGKSVLQHQLLKNIVTKWSLSGVKKRLAHA